MAPDATLQETLAETGPKPKFELHWAAIIFALVLASSHFAVRAMLGEALGSWQNTLATVATTLSILFWPLVVSIGVFFWSERNYLAANAVFALLVALLGVGFNSLTLDRAAEARRHATAGVTSGYGEREVEQLVDGLDSLSLPMALARLDAASGVMNTLADAEIPPEQQALLSAGGSAFESLADGLRSFDSEVRAMNRDMVFVPATIDSREDLRERLGRLDQAVEAYRLIAAAGNEPRVALENNASGILPQPAGQTAWIEDQLREAGQAIETHHARLGGRVEACRDLYRLLDETWGHWHTNMVTDELVFDGETGKETVDRFNELRALFLDESPAPGTGQAPSGSESP